MSDRDIVASALAALKTAFLAILLIALVAVGLAFAFPRHAEFVTQLDIEAPPATVWLVLTDTKEYAEWNPEITSIRGALSPRVSIEVTMKDGTNTEVFHPVVIAVEPDRALRWRGTIGTPGFLSAEHYFELQPRGDFTHFIQGEALHGAALWIADVSGLSAAFDGMNRALKRRAEAMAQHH